MEEGDTHAICLIKISVKAIKKSGSRVSANVRFPELDRGYRTWRLKAQALVRRLVKFTFKTKKSIRIIKNSE